MKNGPCWRRNEWGRGPSKIAEITYFASDSNTTCTFFSSELDPDIHTFSRANAHVSLLPQWEIPNWNDDQRPVILPKRYFKRWWEEGCLKFLTDLVSTARFYEEGADSALDSEEALNEKKKSIESAMSFSVRERSSMTIVLPWSRPSRGCSSLQAPNTKHLYSIGRALLTVLD